VHLPWVAPRRLGDLWHALLQRIGVIFVDCISALLLHPRLDSAADAA
jgi:hypothetical protein